MSRPYQICTKTVMDTSDPSIRFDKDGVSNHYWDFLSNVKPHWEPGEEGERVLERMVDDLKRGGQGKDFDCIMGMSGGADSSYMLHKMVREYGLRPLVFHVDAGWNTDVAVSNINVMIDKLGLDLFTEVINWREIQDFQRAMFRSGVPHLDIPQDMAFIGVLYKFAEKYKIKHILNGGNISTECVLMPLDILYWGTDMVHIRDILKQFGTVEMKTFPFSSVFYHKFYLRYLKGVKVLKPLNFMPYHKKEAIEELQREYGWTPYPQKHFESRFTRFFEGYWLPQRFGYDMRRNQFSSLILTGQMTRQEALTMLERPPLMPEEVQQEFAYIAAKLDITQEELRGYFEMPKKSYRDYKNQSAVFALGARVMGFLAGMRRAGAY